MTHASSALATERLRGVGQCPFDFSYISLIALTFSSNSSFSSSLSVVVVIIIIIYVQDEHTNKSV
jgi:hypothetical protein